MEQPPHAPPSAHPLEFGVEYPERDLNRLTTAFRVFTAIPIAIVLGAIGGSTSFGTDADTTIVAVGGSGVLVLPPLLMILFRRRYPRWWYDFNLELLRFQNRVGVYFALMDDRHPSTDERQGVHLDVPYPDATRLNRWLPLVKWLLAIPHYVVLFLSTSLRCSRSSPRGSRSSSRVASDAESSTTSSAWAAGRTASSPAHSSS